jgi:hypothetical protein
MYWPKQPVNFICLGTESQSAEKRCYAPESNAIFSPGIKKDFGVRGGKWKTYRILCLLVLFFHFSSRGQAQQETNYAVHANIIYHFTKYIDWPADKKNGDFIIGVTGDTPLYDELKKNIKGKMSGNQRIIIRKFSSSGSSFDCHILFISEEESGNIKKIVARTTGSSTLIVSESEGLAQRGACINFVIVSDHLKLEINKKNIEERNLRIASELLQLGKLVK